MPEKTWDLHSYKQYVKMLLYCRLKILLHLLKMYKRYKIYFITIVFPVRRYHDGGHFKPPTMDELPVPQGSWQAQYDANQRRYNSILLFGIAFSVSTIIIVSYENMIYIFCKHLLLHFVFCKIIFKLEMGCTKKYNF